MSLDKVMLIRHAEKPLPGGAGGVDESGKPDPESLTPRGWQRAGALVRFFYPETAAIGKIATPDVVFAVGVGPESQSKRSVQTISSLAALLRAERSAPFVCDHLKDDVDALVADVRRRDGTVLIVWEHKFIATLVNLLSDGKFSPTPWPDDQFDMVWVLDRAGAKWDWSEVPQKLLPEDSS